MHDREVHVGITATRLGMSNRQIATLKAKLRAMQKSVCVVLHHGDCVGGDAQADDLAHRLGIQVVIHPADVPSDKRAYCKGASVVHNPKPPLVRNRDIVNAVGIMFAGPRSKQEVLRSGTWATVRYCYEVSRPLVMLQR